MIPSTCSWFQCLCVPGLDTKSSHFSSDANNKGTARSSSLNDVLESKAVLQWHREWGKVWSLEQENGEKIGSMQGASYTMTVESHTELKWTQPRQSVPRKASSWVNITNSNFIVLGGGFYVIYKFVLDLFQSCSKAVTSLYLVICVYIYIYMQHF